MLINQILKIDEKYFINGDVHDFHESENSTFVLEPTGSKGLYLIGSAFVHGTIVSHQVTKQILATGNGDTVSN